MADFNLTNPDGREVRFSGDVLLEVENDIALADGYDRRIRLAAFSVDGGGYVAEARFESDHPEEQNVTEIEEMDSFDDVDKFFFVFDLEDLCDMNSTYHRQPDSPTSHVDPFSRECEKIIFPFLENLNGIVRIRGLQDRIRIPKKFRFWDILKISAS